MDYRKIKFDVSPKYTEVILKFRKLGIVVNWSDPRRHVDDQLLRYIFSKLGAKIPTPEHPKPITLEEFIYILDQLHLLDGKK